MCEIERASSLFNPNGTQVFFFPVVVGKRVPSRVDCPIVDCEVQIKQQQHPFMASVLGCAYDFNMRDTLIANNSARRCTAGSDVHARKQKRRRFT